MKRVSWVFLSLFVVAGCGAVPDRWLPRQTEPTASAVQEGPLDATEVAQPARGITPPANAQTAEEFDSTSDAERAEAVAEATQTGGERDLGTTLASLGAVGEPGIWLKTPLVSEPGRGRVEYPDKGTKVAVDLIPIDGEQGSGSRISLAAMRLIEADLTSLPELRVFATD